VHIVLVQIQVKPEFLDKFRELTIENGKNSIHEPGIVQFNVLQQTDDPTKWTLVEVYRTPEDQLRHRDTKHYQTWRDGVAEMMAEPRQGIKYRNIFPQDDQWR
jgi:autoinducer 2-degrading protein